MISFCDVDLLCPDQALLDEIEAWLDYSWIWEFSQRSFGPGTGLEAMGFRGLLPQGPVKIGSLLWPSSASRFATAHYLVQEDQLEAIRDYLDTNYSSGGSEDDDSGQLVIDDGVKQVVADMFMLPARPVQRVDDSTPGLYLLTLVDERFFWWTRGGEYTFESGATTWLELYAMLAAALGIALNADTPHKAYGLPGAEFVDALAYQQAAALYGAAKPGPIGNTSFLALPVLLDAAAFSCGQRIVRQLVATTEVPVQAQALNASSAQTLFAADLLLADRIMGDVFDEEDAYLALPTSIAMTFPVREGSTGNGQYYLAEADLPADADGHVGNGEVLTLHCTKAAVFLPGGTVPLNHAALQALATQAAQDWFDWNSLGLDATYSGAVAWQMSGIEALVEYQHTDDRVATRVQRGPWLDHIDRLLIWRGLPPADDCCTQWVRILCTQAGAYGYPGLVQLYSSGSQGFGDLNNTGATIQHSAAAGDQTVTFDSGLGVEQGDVVLVVDGLCSSFAVAIGEAQAGGPATSTTFATSFPSAATAYGVTGITVTSGGSGYAGVAPTVSFSGGSGSGAVAGVAILDPTGDFVIGMTVANPGQDYNPTAPTVVVDDSGTSGSGAAGTANVSGPIMLYLAGVWVPMHPAEYAPEANDVSEPVIFLARQEEDAPDGLRVYLAEGGITAVWACPDGTSRTTYIGRVVAQSG